MYMLRAIMEGKYRFGSPEWDDISEQPKDLVSLIGMARDEENTPRLCCNTKIK
jgi:hypothetical protein